MVTRDSRKGGGFYLVCLGLLALFYAVAPPVYQRSFGSVRRWFAAISAIGAMVVDVQQSEPVLKSIVMLGSWTALIVVLTRVLVAMIQQAVSAPFPIP